MAARVGSRLVVGGVCRAWVSRPMSSQPGTTDATPAADLVVHDNGTASFTFGNPASRLSLDVLEQLATAVQTAQQATSVRCLVLQSRGDVFSSGHNLRELQAASDAEVRHVFGVCSDVMRMIACADIPVMASVQGLATAAGCQLVASCDLAIASSAATFATPGVQIGLFCSTPGVALGRSVPRKQAMHMLLTGHPLTADQALQHGLVSQVVQPEDLKDATNALASTVAEASRPVLRLGKQVFGQQMGQAELSDAYRMATDAMVANLTDIPDSAEGLAAFLEKRPPSWSHADEQP
eukprot:m.99875 g.99875  ORF g.99875 m.99875 type:complete len:294 (-) comp15363_c0_seq1:98-979(-)